MQKILFLTVHRPKRSPSQRFRFEQYIPYLKQNGYECIHYYLLEEKDDKIFYSKGKIVQKIGMVFRSALKLFKLLGKKNTYDFIFIQRECFMLGTSYFEKQLSASKARLIYDFDDSIWLLDVSEANKALAWLKRPEKVMRIMSYADIVVAGNSYLANFAGQFNKNVRIIPTTVDLNQYTRVQKDRTDKICIGWSGSVTTIKHFELAVPVLLKLKQKYGEQLLIKLISNTYYYNEALGLEGILWTAETEIRELSQFDIGIMPLPDDKWAKGKCGLKGLQYMALEIPTIMSPVGVNTEIIRDGENGYLASTEEEWIAKLSLLIESEELREKIGKAGRVTVEQNYSVDAQKENYLQLFK
jgi:glycosyltransferase involved in cell wall biosynthesis